MTGRRILAVGGAHLDRRGRISGAAVAAASNPGEWHEEAGGGVFNAACTLSRLGHAVRLIAPRGGDAAGETVAAAADAAALEDTPLVFLDRATASYTAILTREGELVIALADMAIYDAFGPRQLRRRSMREAIAASDAVLTDANLPAATLAALAAACAGAGKPLFGIAISPAKVTRFVPVLENLAGLFMNAAEAACLGDGASGGDDGLAAALRAAGLRTGVVTRGGAAVLAFSGEETCRVQPPSVDGIRDVTGAGDALAAGFLHARLSGGSLPAALRSGVAASRICLRSSAAVPGDIDRGALEAECALVPKPESLA